MQVNLIWFSVLHPQHTPWVRKGVPALRRQSKPTMNLVNRHATGVFSQAETNLLQPLGVRRSYHSYCSKHFTALILYVLSSSFVQLSYFFGHELNAPTGCPLVMLMLVTQSPSLTHTLALPYHSRCNVFSVWPNRPSQLSFPRLAFSL